MIVKINTTIDIASGAIKDNVKCRDDFGYRILTSEERKTLAELMVKRWKSLAKRRVEGGSLQNT